MPGEAEARRELARAGEAAVEPVVEHHMLNPRELLGGCHLLARLHHVGGAPRQLRRAGHCGSEPARGCSSLALHRCSLLGRTARDSPAPRLLLGCCLPISASGSPWWSCPVAIHALGVPGEEHLERPGASGVVRVREVVELPGRSFAVFGAVVLDGQGRAPGERAKPVTSRAEPRGLVGRDAARPDVAAHRILVPLPIGQVVRRAARELLARLGATRVGVLDALFVEPSREVLPPLGRALVQRALRKGAPVRRTSRHAVGRFKVGAGAGRAFQCGEQHAGAVFGQHADEGELTPQREALLGAPGESPQGLGLLADAHGLGDCRDRGDAALYVVDDGKGGARHGVSCRTAPAGSRRVVRRMIWSTASAGFQQHLLCPALLTCTASAWEAVMRASCVPSRTPSRAAARFGRRSARAFRVITLWTAAFTVAAVAFSPCCARTSAATVRSLSGCWSSGTSSRACASLAGTLPIGNKTSATWAALMRRWACWRESFGCQRAERYCSNETCWGRYSFSSRIAMSACPTSTNVPMPRSMIRSNSASSGVVFGWRLGAGVATVGVLVIVVSPVGV